MSLLRLCTSATCRRVQAGSLAQHWARNRNTCPCDDIDRWISPYAQAALDIKGSVRMSYTGIQGAACSWCSLHRAAMISAPFQANSTKLALQQTYLGTCIFIDRTEQRMLCLIDLHILGES